MARGQNYNAFLKFSQPSVYVRTLSQKSLIPFYRKIHLCKIKCHRYNKTENFDFSIFPALRKGPLSFKEKL